MKLIAVGDSRIRQFFAEFVNYIEPSLDVSYDGHYSRNRTLRSLSAYFVSMFYIKSENEKKVLLGIYSQTKFSTITI